MNVGALDLGSYEKVAAYSPADLGLVDGPESPEFDALTRLAMRLIDVPVALVSIVEEDRDRQFFTSQQGLPEPWAAQRQTPLSHSFCQHVKASGAPLVVPSSRDHPLVCENLAIRDLNVQAYLGMPVFDADGRPLGALCVIDGKPRHWSDEDKELLAGVADCVSSEIKLRAALKSNQDLCRGLKDSRDRISRYNALRESLVMAFMAPGLSPEERFQSLLRQGRRILGADHAAIAKLDGSKARVMFADPAIEAFDAPPIGIGHTLCGMAASGETILRKNVVTEAGSAGRLALNGSRPGSYLAAPLSVDGVLYGALEFSCDSQREAPWSEDEMSILSIIAMVTACHLALHGEIASLKRSETALLDQLMTTKRQCAEGGVA